ncbi:MAG: glycosyltransferase [Anaerolineaceae bacterium]|nr:glycosyltransferase [Anaerolineaceae bacterium]
MISLIATVLNEGQSMHRLMQSVLAQTRLPDETVIVDGGSTDDTVAILQSYADQLPLRILVETGANISAGRNKAIAAAQGDIIAVTDAGVILAPDWLEKITRPLVEEAACRIVGGFFNPDITNNFELAMSATVLPLRDEINPATFLPSSRSIAFRKSIWEAVGGYPEWLDYCEDLIFDLRAKMIVSQQPSDKIAFEPDAIVAFRPRGSLRSFYKQYYLYARGDGKADLWRKRHAARYLTYLVALPIVLLLGHLVHPLLWLLVLPGAYVYLRQPYRRLGKLVASSNSPVTSHKQYSISDLIYLNIMVLVIRIVGDIAKMVGYPAGWIWRLRKHPPDWKEITISG